MHVSLWVIVNTWGHRSCRHLSQTLRYCPKHSQLKKGTHQGNLRTLLFPVKSNIWFPSQEKNDSDWFFGIKGKNRVHNPISFDFRQWWRFILSSQKSSTNLGYNLCPRWQNIKTSCSPRMTIYKNKLFHSSHLLAKIIVRLYHCVLALSYLKVRQVPFHLNNW